MKKLKLSLSNFEGAEMLTRDQLKKVTGGDGGSGGSGLFCKVGSCTVAIQGDDGQWVTRSGTCALDAFNTWACYCDVGLGVVPVTSNGGHSRCNN